MPKFVTGQDLEDAIFDTIQNAKEVLYIVSPFIKLDDYFKEEVFKRHLANPDLHIVVVFGKNSADVKRSLKSEDFEYLRQFPNISVVYVPNLHAKYYANEKSGVLTSINLYDYSFKNNIEFGVVGSPNILGQSEVFVHDAFEAVQDILKENSAILIRRPIFRKRLLKRTYLGSEDLENRIEDLLNGVEYSRVCIYDYPKFISDTNKTTRGRMSRAEFEETQNSLPEPKDKVRSNQRTSEPVVHAKDALQALHQDEGVCISCRSIIPRDSDKPYCYDCFMAWRATTAADEDHAENYCHSCSKETRSSLRKPHCYSCFKKGKVYYPNRL